LVDQLRTELSEQRRLLQALFDYSEHDNDVHWLRRQYERHRRAVIFTDDQQHDSGQISLEDVPLIYTFNLAGYRPSALPTGGRGSYSLGGFTDATFSAMAVLEGGRHAEWPS
jgi:hypothetical protein